MKEQWGDSYKNLQMVPTFVATFENDNWAKTWDKQVHMQIDPKSGMLEKIMDNTGIEESLQKSQKSEQVISKMKKSKQAAIDSYLESTKEAQMKPANDFYNTQQTSDGEPVTMTFMDDYMTAYTDINSSDRSLIALSISFLE